MGRSLEVQEELFHLQQRAIAVARRWANPEQVRTLTECFLEKQILPLNLPSHDVGLVARLAVTYPSSPLTVAEIKANSPETKGKISGRIVNLNEILMSKTKLEIHHLKSNSGETGLFLAGNYWLPAQDRQMMSLLGAGLSIDTVSSLLSKRENHVSGRLDNVVRPWLGAKDKLRAVILLSQYDQLDTELLTARINLEEFNRLSGKQMTVLRTLVEEGGRSNKDIAAQLGETYDYVSDALFRIGRTVSRGEIGNRASLAAAYILYCKNLK